jgi:hypothetical protein
LWPYTAGRGSQRLARIDQGPIATTTASPSTISPLSSATPPIAPLGPRTSSATVPCRSSPPSASAARIRPVVKARGSTNAVVCGAPSWPVMVTCPESQDRWPVPRPVSLSAA